MPSIPQFGNRSLKMNTYRLGIKRSSTVGRMVEQKMPPLDMIRDIQFPKVVRLCGWIMLEMAILWSQHDIKNHSSLPWPSCWTTRKLYRKTLRRWCVNCQTYKYSIKIDIFGWLTAMGWKRGSCFFWVDTSGRENCKPHLGTWIAVIKNLGLRHVIQINWRNTSIFIFETC